MRRRCWEEVNKNFVRICASSEVIISLALSSIACMIRYFVLSREITVSKSLVMHLGTDTRTAFAHGAGWISAHSCVGDVRVKRFLEMLAPVQPLFGARGATTSFIRYCWNCFSVVFLFFQNSGKVR